MRRIGCWLLICSVSILITISASHNVVEILVVSAYASSIVSNTNTSTAPFKSNTSNESIDCDFSSYPDFCIPSPPPNLNCDEVDGEDFTVFPPDPHGFDRDKDGEGCETSE